MERERIIEEKNVTAKAIYVKNLNFEFNSCFVGVISVD